MISGIYESAAAMNLEASRHEAMASNIANASTTGYKKESVVISPFEEIMSSASRQIGSSDSLFQAPAGGLTAGSFTDFSQGPLNITSGDWDVAINGEGFFAVQTPDGTRYTRNGAFAVNADGQLSISGHPEYLVLGDGNSPISIPETGGNVVIDRQGEIIVGDQTAGKLQVTDFDEPYNLVRTGDSLFAAMDGSEGVSAEEGSYSIEQRTLEASNVNIVDEMVGMIINQRNFELGQKMIQSQDQTLDKAISDVGRPQ